MVELYYQILGAALAKTMQKSRGAAIVEGICFQAMQEIREIIRNDAFTDVECIHRIEKIVTVFERIGSDGGTRHDFG